MIFETDVQLVSSVQNSIVIAVSLAEQLIFPRIANLLRPLIIQSARRASAAYIPPSTTSSKNTVISKHTVPEKFPRATKQITCNPKISG